MTYDPKHQLGGEPREEVVKAASPFWPLLAITILLSLFAWTMC